MVEFEKIFGQDYPAKGKLLVSEPFLIDPSFRRTVVLLTEHDKNGTVGFILNRELDVGPGEAIEGFPEFKGKLFLGGPVQQTNLFFIHTLGKKIEGSVSVNPESGGVVIMSK
jgi:putative transcriptional regulator